ncbi:hypothetical protein [Algoriphagus taiwanensis]|uniref:hypothetical protein n=1 Tax=Algoriphagus taiwanensis TaxID=1445656 RepID=UPI0030C67130
MKKEGIEFELVEKEDFLDFISEMESSLVQVKQIKLGKQKKELAKDFLNELRGNSHTRF